MYTLKITNNITYKTDSLGPYESMEEIVQVCTNHYTENHQGQPKTTYIRGFLINSTPPCHVSFGSGFSYYINDSSAYQESDDDLSDNDDVSITSDDE